MHACSIWERLTRKKSKKELHEKVPQHEATVTPKRKLTFEGQDSKSSEPKQAKKPQRVDLQKFVKNPPEPTKTREDISSPPTGTPPLKRQRSKGPEPGGSGNKEPKDCRKAKEAEEDENWALEKYRLKHGEVATSNDEGGDDGEWCDEDGQQEADDEETQDYVEISPATSHKKKDAKPSPKTVSNKKSTNAEDEVPQQDVDPAPKSAAQKKKTSSEGKKEAPSNATKGKTKDEKEETGKKPAKAKAKAKTMAKNSPKSKASSGKAKDAKPLALENGSVENGNEGSDGEVGKYSASSSGPKEVKDPRDKARDKSDAGKSKCKKPEEKNVKNGRTNKSNKSKPESPKKVEVEAEQAKKKQKKKQDEEAQEVGKGEKAKEPQVSQILRSSTAEISEDTTPKDKEKEKQEKLKGYKARKARFYRSLASWDLNARGSFQLSNAQSRVRLQTMKNV
eukprot:s2701_g3.t2